MWLDNALTLHRRISDQCSQAVRALCVVLSSHIRLATVHAGYGSIAYDAESALVDVDFRKLLPAIVISSVVIVEFAFDQPNVFLTLTAESSSHCLQLTLR
jgi:hypothetical protein